MRLRVSGLDVKCRGPGGRYEDEIHLPSDARKALEAAKAAVEKADALTAQAETARVRAVQVLTGRGLSTSDVGRLLGVTRQRAHQLLNAGR